MPIAAVNSINTVKPNQHGIHLCLKVLDWLVTMESVKNGVPIQMSEYLVGDQSGCIVLKVPIKGLESGTWINIKNGYTQVVAGSIRLVVDLDSDIEMATGDKDDSINMSNNLSFIEYLVKY
ncbi:hypothetical protein BC941DRAFT_518869 [Chlamydoabsidia padenii]|nr:hypothetical protein BC941DRAFT_518869 [Chlamydoabsidia padenii]